MSAQTGYDLFVSYADDDREWVSGFLLPALGLPADRVITQQTLTPGAPQAEEFSRAVHESRYTAVVLTPAYLTDRWAMFGSQLAIWSGVDQGAARTVPLLLEPVRLPAELGYQVRLDFTNREQWTAEADRLRKLLNQPPTPPEPDIPCPYPGMIAYEFEDAERYFGREDLVRETVDRLSGQPFIVLIGPSGSGKSSFINAGLMPKLGKDARFGGVAPDVVSVRPGDSPIEHLAAQIARQSGVDPSQLGADLNANPTGLRPALERISAADTRGALGLLIIDQFEEAFAQCKDVALRLRFFDLLERFVEDPPDRWRAIFAVRSDFYGDAQGSRLWPSIKAALVDLPPLPEPDLRRAIEAPAGTVGVYLETRLVDRLVEDAKDERGPLPLIQQTLVSMWTSYLRRRLLTLADYETLGTAGRNGLQEALRNWADGTLVQLRKPGQEEIARRIFIRLIAFGEERKDTRRQQSREELLSAGVAESDVDVVLETLIRRRLVTTDRDATTGEPLVDLAHETLIESWPTLHDWVIAYETMESERRQLVMSAASWREHKRDSSYAMTGTRLQEVAQWAEQWPREVGSQELEFIQASHDVDRRRTLVRRAGLAATIAVAAVVVGAGIWFGRLEYIRTTTGSELVEIPAGLAVIGSDNEAGEDHQVPVEAFSIENHEVSNDQYRDCVASARCDRPVDPAAFDAPGAGDMPVVSVTPIQAELYCAWLDLRLPSATEWERAARGTEGRAWPWGSAGIDTLPILAELRPVQSTETTKTRDEIYELVGNVAEWVVLTPPDIFAEVGGAYDHLPERVADVLPSTGSARDPTVGFRCAVGAG
jgi:hypothetical protein